MKRQIIIRPMKFNFNRALKFIFASVLLITLTCAVRAQGSVSQASNVGITYAGVLNSRPVIHVEYFNQNEDPVELSLTNEEGEVLFSEKLKQKFSRNFQIDVDQNENFKLILVLMDSKDRKIKTFLITRKVTTATDFEVTKL